MHLVMTEDQVTADRAGWKQRRRHGPDGWCITASEIGVLMGLAPADHGSPYRLFYEKTEGIESRDNRMMQRGRYLEPLIVYDFAVAHPGVHVTPGGLYAHDEHPWAMATFDRLGHYTRPGCADFPHANPVEVTVQCKSSGGSWRDPMAPHIRAQVLWEMWIAGVIRAYVPTLYLPSWEVHTAIVDWDDDCDAELKVMLDEAEAFRDLLEAGRPPAPDWRAATRDTIIARHPAVTDDVALIPARLEKQWDAARAAVTAAERRKDRIANLILDRMGDREYAAVRDPDTDDGQRRIAHHQISKRAGYEVPPNPAVHSLRRIGGNRKDTP